MIGGSAARLGVARNAAGDHGEAGDVMAADGSDPARALARFAEAGFDADAPAAQLPDEGAKAFVDSWDDPMSRIVSKGTDARGAG